MKNKFSGWYIASVVSPVYNVTLYQGWRPCVEWCEKTFGGGIGATASGPGWRFVGEGVFEFKTEQDRTLFLLKWS